MNKGDSRDVWLLKNVGLVTVTFNAGKYIDMFMNSLLKQNFPCTLIVVDNHSTDSTLEQIEAYVGVHDNVNIVVLRQSSNLGVAEGNNVGIRWALNNGAQTVVLVNNDVEFEDGCLTNLVQRTHDKGTITVPVMFYGDQPKVPWYAGGKLIPWKGLAIHFDTIPTVPIALFDYAPTCCMSVPVEVFERVGIMAPEYFAYFDDTDFCARLLRYGYDIELVTDSRLYHYVSSSLGADSPFQLYLMTRNRLHFIKQNVFGVSRQFAVLYFAMSRMIRYLQYVIRGDKKRSRALLVGVLDFLNGHLGSPSDRFLQVTK